MVEGRYTCPRLARSRVFKSGLIHFFFIRNSIFLSQIRIHPDSSIIPPSERGHYLRMCGIIIIFLLLLYSISKQVIYQNSCIRKCRICEIRNETHLRPPSVAKLDIL